MTTIQVAETLELRQTLARQIPVDTLAPYGAADGAGGGGAVGGAAPRARCVLSAQLRERAESDLAPIAAPDAPRGLQPLLDAAQPG